MVVHVIRTNEKLRTHVYVLLINLALADISFLCFCAPFKALSYARVSWVFGDALCKATQFVIHVTLNVTIWTLVLIATVRVYIISRCKGMLSRQQKLRGPMMIASLLLWSLVTVASVPFALFSAEQKSGNFTYCAKLDSHKTALTYSTFICSYFAPVVVISIAYSRIIHELFQKGHAQSQVKRTHTARIILFIIFFFGLSWLPYHVYYIATLYGELKSQLTNELLQIACLIFAFANSVVNPFIYNWTCSHFASAFRQVYSCKKSERSQGVTLPLKGVRPEAEPLNGNMSPSDENRTTRTPQV